MLQQKSFDKRFLLVALGIAILLPAIFLLNSMLTKDSIDWYQIIFGGFFTFFITVTISFFNTNIVNILARRIPWNQGWARRLTIELLITSISAALIISLVITVLYYVTEFEKEYSYKFVIFQNAIIAIILNTILISMMEGWELFQMYKYSIIESELLKRQNIESQYSALINQVNPHFLFNSLNVLSFLVSSDPVKAQEFISRFSWIYRYVLDVKDKSLVSLEQEIEFLNAYIFLQKLRYENKLEFKVDIQAGPKELFVPPLSLQILVENAIKHNEISYQNPMMIEVYIEDNLLVVKNRVHIRMDKEESTGFGLKHLQARYEHFTNQVPFFGLVESDYIAKIPLLSEEG
jgi:two-component system, LytTR family, sensor kinase